MPTITYDTVDGSELVFGLLEGTRVRSGVITGMAGPGDDPSTVLEKCIPLLPELSNTITVTDASGRPDTMWLQTIRLQPMFNGDVVRFFLTYSIDIGLQPSVYVITHDSYVTNITFDHTADGIPLYVDYQDTVDLNNRIPQDIQKMSIMVPMRTITISGLRYGTPVPNDQYVGYVNDGAWQGKPTGFWMLTKWKTDIQRWKGRYTFEGTAMTRNYRDWSEQGIIRSPSGRYVKVSLADLTTCAARPYKQGVIYGGSLGTGPDPRKGIIRVGFSPVANFTSLFGFN